jgi:hypothetical protein
MAERSSKRRKKDHDFAVTAFRVVQEAVSDEHEPEEKQTESTPEERHAAAVMLGRRGGKKGGPARADKLNREQRQEIARKAAAARWKKGP